jgi:hypothetical protein
MNVGDLVTNIVDVDGETGMVLKTGIDMWRPEDGLRARGEPDAGATVMWSDGAVELQYEEDLKVISECR